MFRSYPAVVGSTMMVKRRRKGTDSGGTIMVKRRGKGTDSGGAMGTEDTRLYNTVFIDTNLDTHLALLVSHSDTISDLKKKIVFEHLSCFPEMKELKISSVKVKRKGNYYHLSDTMLVSSAFEATKNGWFLSIDASRFQCLGNEQRLLCLTFPQTEAENLLPNGSSSAMDKQKVFCPTESYRAHGNLASSSIMKQKEITKGIGEFKIVTPTNNSQELSLSPRSGPVAKKRKRNHKEDVVNLPVTDTNTSKHGIDNDSEFKIVGNDTPSTNSNEEGRENISMKLVDASAKPVRIQCLDPIKVSKQGMKKSKMGGASAEISTVQDDNDTLDEISHSGTVANKLKMLDSKESSGSPTEFNHKDILKTTIQENSTAGKSIKEVSAEILGDQSVRTDTSKKKKTKKRKNSSMCRDDPACMVLGSTDEGTRGLEQKEGVEVNIFDKLTHVDSTIHVAQSRPEGTFPLEEHASKECPAPVDKELYEMNFVGRPIVESIVSGDNELGTDVANATGESKLIRNRDLKMPMSEKLGDASTTGPLSSYQLGDLQVTTENSFGRKRSKAKKSTSHQELDRKNDIEASQNAHASDRDIVRNDDSTDATTAVGSIMPKIDVDHVNGIVKEGRNTFLPSDNNEAMVATKEQVLSTKTILEDKVNIVEKKLKMKTKRSKISKKRESILSIQDQEVGHQDLAASNDNLGDVNPLPEQMEMDESGRNSHVDLLAGTKLENQKNSGIHSNIESSGKDVRNSDSFQVPSHTLTDGVLEEMHKPEVNSHKGEGINFKQYFVPGQQGKVTSNKPTKSDRDTKSGGKLEDGLTSRGTSSGISNSRIEVSVPSLSSAQGDISLEEVGKFATFDAPAYKKKSKESVDESKSSSSSKGSDRFPEHNRRKTGSEIQSSATRSTKMRTGEVEDFTQPKKGLLTKPGSKSGDSILRRSDSKGGGNSDSTTVTPSDYSSSSDNSIEGSEISQASTPKGGNVAKSNDDVAKHKLKSDFLGQDITMDMILRSSSRFKKAKVTAAQCQDEESQPADVVPDSLADSQKQ